MSFAKKIPGSALIYIFGAVFFLTLPHISAFYDEAALVASKAMGPPFKESVLYIKIHNIGGARGYILNKPATDQQISQLPNHLKPYTKYIYYGGPVEFPEKITVMQIKTDGPRIDDIKAMSLDRALEKNPNLLETLNSPVPRDDIRIFMGYCAWSPLQLDLEILKDHAWAKTKLDRTLLYSAPKEMWERAYNHSMKGWSSVPRGGA